MGSAFPGKYSENYHKRRREDERNPTSGRTVRESNRIRRDCIRFSENINNLLDATSYRRMPWFPVQDVITDRDDDAVIDWRSVAENMRQDGYEIDNDGLLVQMQDAGIKASNRIECVVVYSADRDEGRRDFYMTRKNIFSPFPCPEWGYLPLTLHQWRQIALCLIESRVYWQWEAAVNHYAELRELPAGYTYQYIVGWNLVQCATPSRQPTTLDKGEEPLWTGHIIYTLATSGSFKPSMMSGCLE